MGNGEVKFHLGFPCGDDRIVGMTVAGMTVAGMTVAGMTVAGMTVAGMKRGAMAFESQVRASS
jgi:hypothetical protein